MCFAFSLSFATIRLDYHSIKLFIGISHLLNPWLMYVGIIYDLYIMLCIILLYIFCARKNRGIVLTQYNSLTSIVCNNRVISTVLIFLPIIYIALTGAWKYYVTYAVSSARGLTESNKMALMTPCMLISMIVYFGTVLKKNNLTMKKSS